MKPYSQPQTSVISLGGTERLMWSLFSTSGGGGGIDLGGVPPIGDEPR